jgi:hypothetical protein
MSFPKPDRQELRVAFNDHGVNYTQHPKCNGGRNAWTSGLRAATVHHTAGKNSADYLASFNWGGANCVINHGEYNGREKDGRAQILCWGSAWHSGAGGPWTGVAAKDSLHLVSWGIEIESLGTREDMTDKQIETVGRMLAALVELGMPKGNIHRHADWTDGTGPVRGASSATRGRKMDTNKRWYPTSLWVAQAGRYALPSMAVPDFDELSRASTTPGDKSLASWRLATQLKKLNFYSGVVQPRGEQGYPARAVTAFQHARLRSQEGHGYTRPTHKGIWGLR